MKILADENFPRATIEFLCGLGHDVLWARTGCPCLKDRTLLERAEADSRLVLTLDKDFWRFALQRPTPLRRCGVILFGLFPAIPEELGPLADSTLRAAHSWIGQVAISTLTKEGIEIIPTGSR